MDPAIAEIFGWMALEVEQRNPDGEKPLLILMDGQESLWGAATIQLPDNAIFILDLLHVTPRLWQARPFGELRLVDALPSNYHPEG